MVFVRREVDADRFTWRRVRRSEMGLSYVIEGGFFASDVCCVVVRVLRRVSFFRGGGG